MKFLHAHDVKQGNMLDPINHPCCRVGGDSNVDSAPQHEDLIGMVNIVRTPIRQVDPL